MIKYLQFIIFLFCGTASAQSVTSIRTFEVDGIDRQALVSIPSTEVDGPRPVIFLFHGHGGDMRHFFDSHNFQSFWPEAIVVAPQGLRTPGQLVDRTGKFSGWQQLPGDMNDRDIHFFDEILKFLTAGYHVDTNRIYASGHSNGGSFTYLLWAVRGDVLAAVAPSASVAFQLNSRLQPKPVMHIMGTNDSLVKPAWQKKQINTLLKINGCTIPGKEQSPSVIIYSSSLKTPVEVYTHTYGHTYPAAADQSVVDFFKRYRNLR